MSERILVAVAWPYANGSIHLGQTAGCYLPADIFARYHRLRGNEVLMVSGSDSHGTPVTLEAEKRGVSPEQVFGQYHAEFLDNWRRLGIGFDLFTSTHTDNHQRVSQDMFLRLHENGYIYKDTMTQPYCVTDGRFLADRYVGGVCPHCDFEGARGDQCDSCGRTLDPEELINMVCLLCGDTPEIRDTEHFFLKLTAFEDRLLEWVSDREHWRPNVRNFSVGYVGGGLQDRAITRDIDWGVPVPLDGYEDKRIYVWFEAVIGYLSASIEWAANSGEPERWRDFWQKDCRAYYFMGKDNIPFHTVIWPAMLLGYGDLNLPYDVPANEYLNLEDQKISTSRNWAIWLPDYLDRHEPDPLRYVLASNMPETSDSDFTWREYVRANNDELVATYGNLVHRVLTMSYRNFGGAVPGPGELDADANELLATARRRFDETGENLGRLPVPRRPGRGDVLGAGRQPLPRPQGAVEGGQGGQALRRHHAVGVALRHQLPEDGAVSRPPVQLTEAARHAGPRRERRRPGLGVGPGRPRRLIAPSEPGAAVREAGRVDHRGRESPDWPLASRRPPRSTASTSRCWRGSTGPPTVSAASPPRRSRCS